LMLTPNAVVLYPVFVELLLSHCHGDAVSTPVKELY
jgi:hypothetical protein